MKEKEKQKFEEKEWTKEDLAAWLHAHLGEYIVTRARIHSEIYKDLNRFNKENSARLNVIQALDKSMPAIWFFEAWESLFEILPDRNRNYYPDLRDILSVTKEAEPEVKRVISAITEHSKDAV